jgi:hypothetical protein
VGVRNCLPSSTTMSSPSSPPSPILPKLNCWRIIGALYYRVPAPDLACAERSCCHLLPFSYTASELASLMYSV